MYIVDGAKGSGAQITQVPLYELDHDDTLFTNLTSVFLPKLEVESDYYSDFYFATEIINQLVDD